MKLEEIKWVLKSKHRTRFKISMLTTIIFSANRCFKCKWYTCYCKDFCKPFGGKRCNSFVEDDGTY